MYTSMSYQLDPQDEPKFHASCFHKDGSKSISVILGGHTWISFCGTVGQLELIGKAIADGIANIRERESQAIESTIDLEQ